MTLKKVARSHIQYHLAFCTFHSSQPTPSIFPHHTSPGYIGEVEIIDDRRAGKVVVNLIGRLNKCGVISPRFDVGLKDIEKWTNNLLPSRQFGKLVLTTSAGVTKSSAS
jgi:ribosomal protein S8